METKPRDTIFCVPECGDIALGKLVPQLICAAGCFPFVIQFTTALSEELVLPPQEKFIIGNEGEVSHVKMNSPGKSPLASQALLRALRFSFPFPSMHND